MAKLTSKRSSKTCRASRFSKPLSSPSCSKRSGAFPPQQPVAVAAGSGGWCRRRRSG
jgi:hypothetical protein